MQRIFREVTTVIKYSDNILLFTIISDAHHFETFVLWNVLSISGAINITRCCCYAIMLLKLINMKCKKNTKWLPISSSLLSLSK